MKMAIKVKSAPQASSIRIRPTCRSAAALRMTSGARARVVGGIFGIPCRVQDVESIYDGLDGLCKHRPGHQVVPGQLVVRSSRLLNLQQVLCIIYISVANCTECPRKNDAL